MDATTKFRKKSAKYPSLVTRYIYVSSSMSPSSETRCVYNYIEPIFI